MTYFPVSITPRALTSRSLTTVASVSSQLFAANPSRQHLRFQAPQTAGVWFNLFGPARTQCG